MPSEIDFDQVNFWAESARLLPMEGQNQSLGTAGAEDDYGIRLIYAWAEANACTIEHAKAMMIRCRSSQASQDCSLADAARLMREAREQLQKKAVAAQCVDNLSGKFLLSEANTWIELIVFGLMEKQGKDGATVRIQSQPYFDSIFDRAVAQDCTMEAAALGIVQGLNEQVRSIRSLLPLIPVIR